MGDHGAHLIAPQPTSGHEGKDRQAEADAEQRRINPSKTSSANREKMAA
jgi:hypothetical protein